MKRAPSGHRIGASHHRAKLSDAQVAQLRAAYIPGKVGYESLAKQFGCGISTARDLVQYKTRYA